MVFMTNKPALQQILRRTLWVEGKKIKKTKATKTINIFRNTNPTGNTVALNSYLSIITLNVKGLKDTGYQNGLKTITTTTTTRCIYMLPTRNSF